MLTCPQILSEATNYAPEITEANYREIATLIHPQCEWHPPHKLGHVHATPTLTLIYTALDNLPEVAEANRALDYHTADYTDQVIRLVTLWQANVAKYRYWTDHAIPALTHSITAPTDHELRTKTYDQDTYNNHRARQDLRLRAWAYQPDSDPWPDNAPTPALPCTESTDPNYRIALTYTGPGDTTITRYSATSAHRTTADHIVTQALKLLTDNTWRFSITHETKSEQAPSAPAQPAPRPAATPPKPTEPSTSTEPEQDLFTKIPF